MDNIENTPAVQPDVADLRAECDALRHLTTSLLILLLVISGTLNLFFLRQFRASRAGATELRQMVADYNQNTVPAINDFLHKLLDFEKKYPDFSPILSKYGVRPGTFTGVPPVSAIAPAPAAALPSAPAKP